MSKIHRIDVSDATINPLDKLARVISEVGDFDYMISNISTLRAIASHPARGDSLYTLKDMEEDLDVHIELRKDWTVNVITFWPTSEIIILE